MSGRFISAHIVHSILCLTHRPSNAACGVSARSLFGASHPYLQLLRRGYLASCFLDAHTRSHTPSRCSLAARRGGPARAPLYSPGCWAAAAARSIARFAAASRAAADLALSAAVSTAGALGGCCTGGCVASTGLPPEGAACSSEGSPGANAGPSGSGPKKYLRVPMMPGWRTARRRAVRGGRWDARSALCQTSIESPKVPRQERSDPRTGGHWQDETPRA